MRATDATESALLLRTRVVEWRGAVGHQPPPDRWWYTGPHRAARIRWMLGQYLATNAVSPPGSPRLGEPNARTAYRHSGRPPAARQGERPVWGALRGRRGLPAHSIALSIRTVTQGHRAA